jgi:hypothetical protein
MVGEEEKAGEEEGVDFFFLLKKPMMNVSMRSNEMGYRNQGVVIEVEVKV